MFSFGKKRNPMNYEKLLIGGTLGADARQHTPKNGGKEFMLFTLAVNRYYKDKQGQNQQKTIWYKVFSYRLGLLPYLKKGRRVLVEGTPSAEGYQAEDGSIRAQIQLSLTALTFGDSSEKPTEILSSRAMETEEFAGDFSSDDLAYLPAFEEVDML